MRMFEFEFALQAPWLYARRRRALIETPTAAKRIWVHDSIGNFYFVKADFGKGPRTIAEHNEVRNTVAQLEAAGCVVENVPEWCRNHDAPPPVTASYGDAHPPIFITMMLTLVGMIIVDWIMLHFHGHGLFPH
jgi:hypothetical protein